MYKEARQWWKKFIDPTVFDSKQFSAGTPIILPADATWEPILERLKAVELKPGDTLVIEVPHLLQDRGYTLIMEQIKKSGYKAVIMEEGISLRGVLREDNKEKTEHVEGGMRPVNKLSADGGMAYDALNARLDILFDMLLGLNILHPAKTRWKEEWDALHDGDIYRGNP